MSDKRGFLAIYWPSCVVFGAGLVGSVMLALAGLECFASTVLLTTFVAAILAAVMSDAL